MLYEKEKEKLDRIAKTLETAVEAHGVRVKRAHGILFNALAKARRQLFEHRAALSAQVARPGKAPKGYTKPAVFLPDPAVKPTLYKEPLVLEACPAEKPRKARKQAAQTPSRMARIAPAYQRERSLFSTRVKVPVKTKEALMNAKEAGWSWNAMGDCAQVNSKFVWRFIVGDRNGPYNPVLGKKERVPQEECNQDELMRLELFLDHADAYDPPPRRKGKGEPKFPFKQLEAPLEKLLADEQRMAALNYYRSRAQYTVKTGLGDLKRTPAGATNRGVGRGLLWLIDSDPELHNFMEADEAIREALEIPASSQGTPKAAPSPSWRK